jgi:exopolysaccharide production protein ExoQ
MDFRLDIKKNIHLTFYFVIFFSTAPFNNYFAGVYSSIPFFTYIWLVGSSLMFFSIFISFWNVGTNRYWNKNELIVIFICLYCFISILWSENKLVTLNKSIVMALNLSFLIIVTRFLSFDEVLEVICKSFIVVFIISIVLVIIDPTNSIEQTHHDSAWKGIFYQKNVLGRYASIGVVIGVFSSFYGRKRNLGKWLLLFSIICLLGSQSKTSLLTCLIGVSIIICFRMQSFIKNKRVFGWFVFSIILMLIGMVYLYVDEILLSLGKDLTLTGRTNVWPFVWNAISERQILGYGYNAFWSEQGSGQLVKDNFFWSLNHAHNGFLEVSLDFGWLFTFLFTIFILIKPVIQQMKVSHKSKFLLIPLLICIIFQNITQTSFLSTNNFITLLLYLTFLYSSKNHGVDKTLS